MNSYAGVAKILRFNWPWYAGALLVTTSFLILLGRGNLDGSLHIVMVMALVMANGWLVLSLLVSYIVYDVSALSQGCWLQAKNESTIVILHAGHDEASVHVRRILPQAVCHSFDFCVADTNLSPSLRRARSEATAASTTIKPDHIPVPDGTAELVLIIFSAHELRVAEKRVQLFGEIARVIGATGRAVVVEHQRDIWNCIAYGPGFFHFLSRSTWIDTFTQAHLRVMRDDTITPWVHRFELRTTP